MLAVASVAAAAAFVIMIVTAGGGESTSMREAIDRCRGSVDAGTCSCIVEVMGAEVGIERTEAALSGRLVDAVADAAFLGALQTCGTAVPTTAAPTPTTTVPPADTTIASTTTSTGSDTAPTQPTTNGATCSNDVYGFTYSVPVGWEATDGDTPAEACRFVARPDSFGDPTIIVEAVTNFTYQEMFDSLEARSIWFESGPFAGGFNAFAAIEEVTQGDLAGTQELHIVTDTKVPIWFFVQLQPDYLDELDDYNDIMIEMVESLLVR